MEFVDKHSIQNPSNSPFLDWIKNKDKMYEGRLKIKIKEWNLCIGKEIIFFDQLNPDSWAWVRVTSLHTFGDFGEAFDVLGSKLIPDRTRDQVVGLYDGLFGEVAIKAHGVVVIGFELVDSSPKL